MKFLREPDDTFGYMPDLKDISSLTWKLPRGIIMEVIVGGGHHANAYTAVQGCNPSVFSDTIDSYSHVRVVLRTTGWDFLFPAYLDTRLSHLMKYWHLAYVNGFCVPIEYVNDILEVLDQ